MSFVDRDVMCLVCPFPLLNGTCTEGNIISDLSSNKMVNAIEQCVIKIIIINRTKQKMRFLLNLKKKCRIEAQLRYRFVSMTTLQRDQRFTGVFFFFFINDTRYCACCEYVSIQFHIEYVQQPAMYLCGAICAVWSANNRPVQGYLY